MGELRALSIVAVVALCTFLTRLLPFIIFRKKQKLPPTVQYLGDILPMAVIAILVVYCLKDINYREVSRILPTIISVGAVMLLHIWKRNNLLSIGGGTLLYMILVQTIF